MERIDSYLCSSGDLSLQPYQRDTPCRSLSLSPLWLSSRSRGSQLHHVGQLWAALDKTLQHSKCGVGSDTPVKMTNPDPNALSYPTSAGVPPPPEPLPEMEDAVIVKPAIQALSPRVVAVHGPAGTGISRVPISKSHSGLNRLKD